MQINNRTKHPDATTRLLLTTGLHLNNAVYAGLQLIAGMRNGMVAAAVNLACGALTNHIWMRAFFNMMYGKAVAYLVLTRRARKVWGFANALFTR